MACSVVEKSDGVFPAEDGMRDAIPQEQVGALAGCAGHRAWHSTHLPAECLGFFNNAYGAGA